MLDQWAEASVGREGFVRLRQPQALARRCDKWNEFCNKLGVWLDDKAPVYMGRRCTPSGRPRLVCIYADSWMPTSISSRMLMFSVTFAPGTLYRKPQLVKKEAFDLGAPSGDRFRLYCGQADANDPTHFTVRYEVYAGKGIVHFWLQDDETVRVSVLPDAGVECGENKGDASR